MTEISHFIDGRAEPGLGALIQDLDPLTGQCLATCNEATPEQVSAAVEAANRSFETGTWAHMPVADRQQILWAAAAAIRAASDDLVALQIAEAGIPEPAVRAQLKMGAGWFDYFADYLSTRSGEVFDQIEGTTTLVTQEPIGVCALFTPWNVPITLSAVKLAPALAAGNSVVWKPSEMTPLVTRKLCDVLHGAGLPNGVLNLVNGRGATTGAALANAPSVAMMTYTGGHLGGAAVAQVAAQRHIPCVTELGGKSATIIFDDTDLDKAVPGAVAAAYGNNGQACLVGARLLIQDAIYDAFISRFEEATCALTLGDPRTPGVALGPMISPEHRDHVARYFDPSQGEILFGGTPQGHGFITPGAVRVASTQAPIWHEEVFGPVVAVKTFGVEAEAIALANDSAHGLAGYVWTQDIGRAMRVARAVRTGTMIVNSAFRRELNAPFGGYKLSGVGREGGRHSYANFTQCKTTVVVHE